jgi:hypothetical protein
LHYKAQGREIKKRDGFEAAVGVESGRFTVGSGRCEVRSVR